MSEEEIKPCPGCGRDGERLGLTAIVCSKCESIMPLKTWNAMPRREEFYVELVGLKKKAYTMGGMLLVIKELAEKYAPEVDHGPV